MKKLSILVIGFLFFATASLHPINAQEEEASFIPVNDLKIGDWVFVKGDEENLVPEKITKHEWVEGPIEVYNLTVEGDETFFANSFAVHNKGEDTANPQCGVEIQPQLGSVFWSYPEIANGSETQWEAKLPSFSVTPGKIYEIKAQTTDWYNLGKRYACTPEWCWPFACSTPWLRVDTDRSIEPRLNLSGSGAETVRTYVATKNQMEITIGFKWTRGDEEDCGWWNPAGTTINWIQVREIGGASSALSNNVNLRVGIWDDLGMGQINIQDGGWQSFTWNESGQTLSATLPANGAINVKVKDNAGKEGSCSDTISVGNPPEVISLNPTSLQCPASTQTYTFTAVYKDIDGLTDIKYGQFIIDVDADWSESPYPYFRGLYAPNDVAGWDESTAGKFYLYKRWGNGGRNWNWGGGATSGILQNDYVILDVGSSSASWNASQNRLTVTWAVKFKDAFPKEQEKSYLYVEDMGGAQDTILNPPALALETVSGFTFHRMGTVDTRCGTITGKVFDSSQTGTTCLNLTTRPALGGATVTADDLGDGAPTTTSQPDGSYSFSGLSGTYLVSASKTDYVQDLACPSGSLIVPPDQTDINFGLSAVKDAWFQTKDGDVHAQTNISDPIPNTVPASERYCSLLGDGGYPGVISYGGTSYDFSAEAGNGRDMVSPDPPGGWLANSSYGGITYGYDYFYSLVGSPTLINDPDDTVNQNQLNDDLSAEGIVAYDGDIKTGSEWNVGGTKAVILVKGKFLLKDRIRSNPDGSIVIVAKDGIGVSKNLGATGEGGNIIRAIFITDGMFYSSVDPSAFPASFATADSEKKLVIDGSVIAWGGVNFTGRDFSVSSDPAEQIRNNTEPVEFYRYDPALFIDSSKNLWKPTFTWQELAP